MQAGEKAVCCGVSNTSDIDELSFIKELHLKYITSLVFFVPASYVCFVKMLALLRL